MGLIEIVHPLDPEDLLKLGLYPLDMVDLAAFNHDKAYYSMQASGVKRAILDWKVKEADAQLAKDATNVISLYFKGGEDVITRESILERTYTEAKMVLGLFGSIATRKGLVDAVPSVIRTIQSGFNNMINSLNSAISHVH